MGTGTEVRESYKRLQRCSPTHGRGQVHGEEARDGEATAAENPDAEETYEGEGWTWWHRGGWHGRQDWRSRSEWDSEEDYEEHETVKREEFDLGDADILPEEVLGWLLLRRAGLPASSRLAVQSATGNSLKFSEIERALRDQEEEWMQAESSRQGGQFQRRLRSYWVEENGERGLMPNVGDDENTQIMWVGMYQVDQPGLPGRDRVGDLPGRWTSSTVGVVPRRLVCGRWRWNLVDVE